VLRESLRKRGGNATIVNTIFSEIEDANISLDALSVRSSLIRCRINPRWSEPEICSPIGIHRSRRAGLPAPLRLALHRCGRPATDPDPDGSRADIGALPYENPAQALAVIRLNEIMTSNTKTLQDERGEYDDWIELYNSGSTPVDLGGLYLTDTPDNPTRWQLPKAMRT